jgi:hypothetical protein
MTGFTTNVFLSRNRVSPKEAFEGLELCERKLSCTVLRGLDGSNPVRLLGDSGANRKATGELDDRLVLLTRSAVTVVPGLGGATISRCPSLVPGSVPSFLQLAGPVQHHLQRCRPFLVRGLHQQEAPAICLVVASCVDVASSEEQVCGV